MSRLLLLLLLVNGCKTDRNNLKIQTVQKETVLQVPDGSGLRLPSQKINAYQYTHIATQVYFTATGAEDTVDALNNNFDNERAFWTTNFQTLKTSNASLSNSEQLSMASIFFNGMWNAPEHLYYIQPIFAHATVAVGDIPATTLSASILNSIGRIAFSADTTQLDSNTAYVLASISADLNSTPIDQQLTMLTSKYGFSNPVTIFNTQNQLIGFFGQKNTATIVMINDAKALMQEDFSTPLVTTASLHIQMEGQVSAAIGQTASVIWQQILKSSFYSNIFSGKRVWFAGQGTGGAVAALLGIYQGESGGTALVYGFGAPRFANADFAAAFATGKAPNVSVYQFYNQVDLIRFYPPSAAMADIFATYADPLVQP